MKRLVTYGLAILLALQIGAPLVVHAQVESDPTISPDVYESISKAATANAQAAIDSGQTISPTTQTQNPSIKPANTAASSGPSDLSCNLTNGQGVVVCVSQFVYWIAVGVPSWLANIAAYIFDYATYLSIDSHAYGMEFIAQGWSVVRDIVNMSFLFILVYIGFKVIFNAETSGTMRMLVGVIIVALLVNFSFFITRAVIDAGNIFAAQFYNAVAVDAKSINESAAQTGNASVGQGGQTKDITATIMNALGVQQLLAQNSFKNVTKDNGGSPMYYLIVTTVIYLLTGVSLLMVGFTLLFVGIKFMLRVVALWGLIIVAPAAFVAAIFRGDKLTGWGGWFEKWLKYLLKFTFYPAIFLFMFWLQTKFVKEMANASLFNNVFNATAQTTSWTAIVSAAANVGVRLGFIIATLYVSLHVADWVVEEGSKQASWVIRNTRKAGVGTLRWGGNRLATLGYNRDRAWNNLRNRDWGSGSTPREGSGRVSGGATLSTSNALRRRGGIPQHERVEPGVPSYAGAAPEPRADSPGTRDRSNLPRGARIEPVVAHAPAPAVRPPTERAGAPSGKAQADFTVDSSGTARSGDGRARTNLDQEEERPAATTAPRGSIIPPQTRANTGNLDTGRSGQTGGVLATNLSAQRAIQNTGERIKQAAREGADQVKHAAQAGAVAASLSGEPDMTHASQTPAPAAQHGTAPEQNPEMKELASAVRDMTGALRDGKPLASKTEVRAPAAPTQQISYTYTPPLKPSEVHADVDVESLANKLKPSIKKAVHREMSNLHPPEPPTTTPPAAQQPAPQQQEPDDYPYHEAAE